MSKTAIKRLVFALIWFMVLAYGASMIGAFIAELTLAESTDEAARALAREQFARTFGPYLFIGSLVVVIAGMVMGWLPGSRK